MKKIPLFEHYQLLADKLPYLSLGEFPTPVQKLDQLGRQIGLNNLYIKRDDLSGKVYGGNKIRKLEFLLGDALRTKVKEVLTFGAAGSNHALATAIYAKQLGIKSISMLIPQPNAYYVRRNLLMSYHCGTELHLYQNIPFIMPIATLAVLYQLLRHRLKRGQFPKVIPIGGSSPLGIVGFVNAAFELKEQVDRNEIPEPDYLYVATGTMGTAAGLILGLRATSLKTHVVPVRVTDKKLVTTKDIVKLIQETNSLLHSKDSSFPELDFSEKDVDIKHDFYGQQYALFTEEGMQAVARMKDREGIKLDGTYTGKTVAAIIHDAQIKKLSNKVVLFWNTLNSRDFSDAISDVDYHNLPRRFHRYFEEEVQTLERE